MRFVKTTPQEKVAVVVVVVVVVVVAVAVAFDFIGQLFQLIGATVPNALVFQLIRKTSFISSGVGGATRGTQLAWQIGVVRGITGGAMKDTVRLIGGLNMATGRNGMRAAWRHAFGAVVGVVG